MKTKVTKIYDACPVCSGKGANSVGINHKEIKYCGVCLNKRIVRIAPIDPFAYWAGIP